MSTHLNFGVQLPIEICDKILTYLDGCELLKICRVCKEWNNHISTSAVLWRRVCVNSGFVVRKGEGIRDAKYWKKFHRVMTERMKELKTSACFDEEEFEYSSYALQHFYYYKGKIALAFYENCIKLWGCAVKSVVLHISCDFRPMTVKFDDHVIMAAEEDSGVVSWNATTGKLINRYIQPHSKHVIPFDFSTKSNVMVSSHMTSNLNFWNLSTGANIKTVASLFILENMMLTPDLSEYTSDHKKHFLFTQRRFTVMMWVLNITSDVLSPESLTIDKMREIDPRYFDISKPFYIIGPLHFDGRFLHIFLNSGRKEYTVLTWDTQMNNFSSEINLNMKVNALLGVGKKFLLILKGTKVFILNKETHEEISSFHLPRFDFTPNLPSLYTEKTVMVGEKSWLDGLNGENDQGVVLLSNLQKRIIYIKNWTPRLTE